MTRSSSSPNGIKPSVSFPARQARVSFLGQLGLLGHARGRSAIDPMDANAAAWLRGQIRERFKQPTRYVIYSHDHADHISGGEVLADTAQVVAH